MSEPKFKLERAYRIFNDFDGSFIAVSEDPDGFGCVEVGYYDRDKLKTNLLLDPKQVPLLIEALNGIMETLKNKE